MVIHGAFYSADLRHNIDDCPSLDLLPSPDYPQSAMSTRILVVDDNRLYREAVTRNLLFNGYDVIEAQNKTDALDKMRQALPEVVITDLDMGVRTAGIDLIREIKREYPLMPVILVSAVGTFDEGALARQYGAMYVISKSRIDAEIGNLYRLIDQSQEKVKRIVDIRERLAEAGDAPTGMGPVRTELETLLGDPELDTGMKSEIYDLVAATERSARLMEVQAAKATVGAGAIEVAEQAAALLRKDIPKFDELQPETREMLLTAENMKIREDQGEPVAFSRNIGFSYTFAIENEIKERLGAKVRRLLSGKEVFSVLDRLYDERLGNLDIFFNQHCIMVQQQQGLDLNIDITRQVLERIRAHRDRYKPDGLKALGVMVFCFGREYAFKSLKGDVKVENPLGLKGLEDLDRLRFANSLIRLQHLRNPYIHPEFTEREKTDSIRQAAIECINYGAQLV